MKAVHCWALAGSAVLALSVMAAAGPAAAATPPPRPPRVILHGSVTPGPARSRPAGAVAASTPVSFALLLSLRNPGGARAFLRDVSVPGSPLFRRYLTDAQWESRFGPPQAEVTTARSWLRREGFTTGPVPADRLFVPARGPARRVEQVFGVRLGYYLLGGHRLRLTRSPVSIPSSLAGTVAGVVGINQFMAVNGLARVAARPGRAGWPARPGQEPPPPPAFRNPHPCAAYWGQKTDTRDQPGLYQPYHAPLHYAVCGYRPSQLRGGYGLTGPVAAGRDGAGVTIAIVDAYDSPRLLHDAQTYARLNDPAHPLASSQFFDVPPVSVSDQGVCQGSSWFAEQALDVEASHAMAPGAAIRYVGAQNCFDQSLLSALQTAVTSGAAVVSDSWGDTLGDLLADTATKTAYDDTFLLAGATGVSVLFSSGDDGDNFGISGLTAPDYPASSPFVTAVGGTTLEVTARRTRHAEYGWSTAKQVLCTRTATSCGSDTTPAGDLAWQSGGGGDTSYTYGQPAYQAGIVPGPLALRNQALFGHQPMRVIPDISLDADPQSGMLAGLTQTFPKGVHYGQFKLGGTSLASPLLAGVVADAGRPGFLNPVLYQAFRRTPAVFRDILPPAAPHSAAVIRVDFANSVDASHGFIVSLRVIGYAGREVYCDATGNCARRRVTLTAARGFDGLTGLGSPARGFLGALTAP